MAARSPRSLKRGPARSGGSRCALGPESKRVLALLRRFESPNVTCIEPDGSWPRVWARARGCRVWDADGHAYVDLTAAFGVSAAGHGNRAVMAAARRQLQVLAHAMGDVHPHALKARLARRLSQLTFGRWGKGERGRTVFCNSGFEAVEAALKTALLATNRPGVLAFEGAYHGLGYGTLNATHRGLFRGPFERQLGGFAEFLPYPCSAADLPDVLRQVGRLLHGRRFGCVLVEPVQGRAGVRVPAAGFLDGLQSLCRRHGALLVLDEIYTGFGRTGRWFACEHEGVRPDLICLGKALTGGFPLSACVGRAAVMERAWPPSAGEAMHTSTFLGHPVGCAMALAQIEEIQRRGLVRRSAQLGAQLLERLGALQPPTGLRLRARGRGLMAAVEIQDEGGRPLSDCAMGLVKAMLHEGFMLLPEGEAGNVLAFTPPLTIGWPALRRATAWLQALLRSDAGRQSDSPAV